MVSPVIDTGWHNNIEPKAKTECDKITNFSSCVFYFSSLVVRLVDRLKPRFYISL
jgi:hypothetical protein